MEFDPREFRRALGQFATGAAVITARQGGITVGMTMSSFNSVSIDPPLILFSVDRKALSLQAMLEAKGYAVSILSRPQEPLSNQFARALGDKWASVAHTVGYMEAPLLGGALAHFECEPYAHHDGGDHVIFIGRVVRFTYNTSEDPLIFFQSNYHSLKPHDQRAPEWPLPIHY